MTKVLTHQDDAGGWQPMETAPQDGTDILAAFDPSVGWQQIIHWHKKKSGHRWVDSYTLKNVYNSPTHWRSLPDHPYTKVEQDAVLKVRTRGDWGPDEADRIRELEDALRICADELEHEINASYDEKYGDHPAMEKRRQRDLITVREARAILDPKGCLVWSGDD